MSNKCDPNCYTNGKGCALSTDGRCLHMFNNGEGELKFSTKTYHDPKKDKKPVSGMEIRKGLRYLQYKGIRVEFDGKDYTYNYDILTDTFVRVKPKSENKI